MSRRSRRRRAGDGGKLSEITAGERDALWLACCASSDGHRFDCGAAEADQRGPGPFGPVRTATPADLIARMRESP